MAELVQNQVGYVYLCLKVSDEEVREEVHRAVTVKERIQEMITLALMMSEVQAEG